MLVRAMLGACLVIASAQRLEVREHPVEAMSKLIRITAEEAHGVLQTFGFRL